MARRTGKRQPVVFAELGAGKGGGRVLAEAISVGRLGNSWATIVGSSLAQKTRPYRVSGKTLTINVSDSPLLQQMSFMRDDLLQKIRQDHPETSIDKIQFKIGKVVE